MHDHRHALIGHSRRAARPAFGLLARTGRRRCKIDPLRRYLLAWHRPRNPIGWLFLAGGVAYATSTAAVNLLGLGGTAGWSTVVLRLLAWLFMLAWPWAIGLCLPLALLLFPDGRPAGRRWCWLIWAIVAEGVLFELSFAAPGRQTFGRRSVVPYPGDPALRPARGAVGGQQYRLGRALRPGPGVAGGQVPARRGRGAHLAGRSSRTLQVARFIVPGPPGPMIPPMTSWPSRPSGNTPPSPDSTLAGARNAASRCRYRWIVAVACGAAARICAHCAAAMLPGTARLAAGPRTGSALTGRPPSARPASRRPRRYRLFHVRYTCGAPPTCCTGSGPDLGHTDPESHDELGECRPCAGRPG